MKSCVAVYACSAYLSGRAGEISSPFKVCKFVVKFLSSLAQEDRTELLVRVNLQGYINKPRSTLVLRIYLRSVHCLISSIGAFFVSFCFVLLR